MQGVKVTHVMYIMQYPYPCLVCLRDELLFHCWEVTQLHFNLHHNTSSVGHTLNLCGEKPSFFYTYLVIHSPYLSMTNIHTSRYISLCRNSDNSITLYRIYSKNILHGYCCNSTKFALALLCSYLFGCLCMLLQHFEMYTFEPSQLYHSG